MPAAPAGSRQMHEIRPRLFLGSIHAAGDRSLLVEHGITHVVSVMECDMGHRQRVRLPPSQADPITRLLVSAPDTVSARLDRHFDACSAFIAEGMSKGSVLVHCKAGQSRSPTVVIAHLMREEGWGADQALRFVQKQRPSVQPNIGFMEQLRALEVRLDLTPTSISAESTSIDSDEVASRTESSEGDSFCPADDAAQDREADKAPEATTPTYATEASTSPVNTEDIQVEISDLFGARETRLRSERFRSNCRRLNPAASLLSVAAPLRKRRYRG